MDLEARLRRIEDLREIDELVTKYGYGANIINGGPGDLTAFGALFTDSAVWDVGLGKCIGGAAIEACMRGLPSVWHVSLHLIVNRLIEVNGDEASGTFAGLFPFCQTADAKPIWLSNVYRNSFVRTASGWRIQSVTAENVMVPAEFAPA